MAADVFIWPPVLRRDFVARYGAQGKASAVQLLASAINNSGQQLWLWIKIGETDQFKAKVRSLVVDGEVIRVQMAIDEIELLLAHQVVADTYMVVGSADHWMACPIGLPSALDRRMFVSQNLVPTATMQIGTQYFGFADASPVTPVEPGDPGTPPIVNPNPTVWRMGFLGDSTVQGSPPSGGVNEATYVSWRGPIQPLMTANGVVFTVVGVRYNNTRDNKGSPIHAAQGGSKLLVNTGDVSQLQLVDEFFAAVAGPYNDLLMWLSAGINDAPNGTTAKVATDYKTLVRYIRTKAPGVRVAMLGMGVTMWVSSTYHDALDAAMDELVAENSLNYKLSQRLISYSDSDFYETSPTPRTHLTNAKAVDLAQSLWDQAKAKIFTGSVPVDPKPPTGSVNSVEIIVSDMKMYNDFPLRGYSQYTVGWYVGPGYVMMGNVANTSNSAAWWKASNPGRYPLVCRAILPWIVLFDGVNHGGSNFRVQMRGLKLYIKRRNPNTWYLVGQSGPGGISGFHSAKAGGLVGSAGNEDRIVLSDGSVAVKMPTNTTVAWHGWSTRYTIDPDNIEAVHVTCQARLIVDNPALPDDRSSAQVGFQQGADYYRDTSSSWVDGNGDGFTIPSIATARTKRVTNNWQAFSATTFSNVGIQEPGGGITEAAFRALPPPIE